MSNVFIFDFRDIENTIRLEIESDGLLQPHQVEEIVQVWFARTILNVSLIDVQNNDIYPSFAQNYMKSLMQLERDLESNLFRSMVRVPKDKMRRQAKLTFSNANVGLVFV